MRKFAGDISQNLLGNIKYRNNVVTGEIAVDNGNYTYDVYMSSSTDAYPNVPTTMREPDFVVGDAVEILIEYGNKEMLIIIGLAKKVVQEVEVIDINTLVTTLDAYSITVASGYLEGRIENIDGYENCLLQGFHYGLTTGYGTDTYTTGSFAAGSYSLQITGLNDNTNYHYQAYVYDADGDEQTGEGKSMITKSKRIYVMYQDNDTSNHLKQYNISGNLLNTWNVPTGYYQTNCICVDNDNNIYINYGTSIIKRNSNGEIILTKTGISNSEAITIGTDGYIYSRESFGDDVLVRRNASDLDSVDYIALYNANWYGLAFDSSNNFYMCNSTTDAMEKWQYTDYGRLSTKAIGTAGAEDSGLCIVGSNIGMAAGFQGAFTMPTNLSSSESDFNLGNIDSFVHETPASLGDAYIFVGDYLGTHLAMQSYNAAKTLNWEINVSSTGDPSVDSAAAAAYPF